MSLENVKLPKVADWDELSEWLSTHVFSPEEPVAGVAGKTEYPLVVGALTRTLCTVSKNSVRITTFPEWAIPRFSRVLPSITCLILHELRVGMQEGNVNFVQDEVKVLNQIAANLTRCSSYLKQVADGLSLTSESILRAREAQDTVKALTERG